jgi:hypothetical protein
VNKGRVSTAPLISRPLVFVMAVGAVLRLTACHPNGSADGASHRSAIDTGGVPLVNITRSALDRARQWTLADAPDLVVAPGATGPGARILKAAVLTGGSIAALVRDSSTGRIEVMFYDSAGTPILLPPPRASPPGVVREEPGFITVADSLYIVGSSSSIRDDGARVAWIQGPRGKARTLSPLPDEIGPLLGAMADHSLIAASDPTEAVAVGSRWSTNLILRVSKAAWAGPATFRVDTLLTVATRTDGSGSYLLWTHEPLYTIAVANERIWVALSGEPEIMAISGAGRPVLRVRWNAGDRSVPDSAIIRWRESVAESLPNSVSTSKRMDLRARLSRQQHADSFSAVARLVADRSGRVYVRLFELHRVPQPSASWLVFEQDGRLAGRLRIPNDMVVIAAVDGRILVRVESPAGGHQLHRYPLVDTISTDLANPRE